MCIRRFRLAWCCSEPDVWHPLSTIQPLRGMSQVPVKPCACCAHLSMSMMLNGPTTENVGNHRQSVHVKVPELYLQQENLHPPLACLVHVFHCSPAQQLNIAAKA